MAVPLINMYMKARRLQTATFLERPMAECAITYTEADLAREEPDSSLEKGPVVDAEVASLNLRLVEIGHPGDSSYLV